MIKKPELDIIKDKYFSSVKDNSYVISYLFIEDKSKPALSIDTIVLKTIEAMITEDCQYDWNHKLDDKYSYILTNEKTAIKVRVNTDTNEEKETIWEMTFESDFFTLEKYRTAILSILRTVFAQRYCLLDQVSFEICKRAYPFINELENLLREYLLRFFIKKLGSNWWRHNSTETLRQKSKAHGATRSFNGLLDMEIYNIDFVDLRELITGNFPTMSHSDILQALEIIEQSKEYPEKVVQKIETLKGNFLGNWEKFFEKHILIDDFRTKWQRLYDIRCMISHNSLVTLKNFMDLIQLYENIKPAFIQIIKEMVTAQLSTLEKETVITEEEMQNRLRRFLNIQIRFSKNDIEEIITNGFVTVTSNNFSGEIQNLNEFKEKISSIHQELESLLPIDNFLIQGEESVPSCWIKFKQIDPNTFRVLKYGIKTNAFMG
ncbi:hypothetical protein SY88_04980 [Clostridiales bacterium PH28_bin88]|nr:hypothetical protein SY88_04980 [Clostridiales bacterium PH28_bin88]